MGRFGAWAVGLVAMSVGCATIAGIGGEYELASSGGGRGMAGSGGSVAGSGGGGATASGNGSGTSTGSGDGATTATGCNTGSSTSTGVGGAPATPPQSCMSLASTCGLQANEDCCASPLLPGGTYNRNNNAKYPATVSPFRLDKFEVTVGRFRAFVDAYPGSKPKAGDGAHPKIAGSGWSQAWDTRLPASKADLLALINDCVSDEPAMPTWTDTKGANEALPMSCISWHEAFAFCAWDGGRLPTEAEWNYASAGGADQRKYPWGCVLPDSTLAVYDCMGDESIPEDCAFTDILRVGSRPKGAARWGQMDMAGSMWEYTLDWFGSTYDVPCVDCANQKVSYSHVAFGGSWVHGASDLLTTFRGDIPVENYPDTSTYRNDRNGLRCAREP